MDSRVIFIIWLAILFLGQVSSRRKRQNRQQKREQRLIFMKKLPFPLPKQFPLPRQTEKSQQSRDPEPFTCEQANEPAQAEPMRPKVREELHTSVRPMRSSLKEEITDLKPEVAPQVQEEQRPKPVKVLTPALQGSLRQGMLWSMVLGEPRSKQSWAAERVINRGSVRRTNPQSPIPNPNHQPLVRQTTINFHLS